MADPSTSKRRKRKKANPLPWILLALAVAGGGIFALSSGKKSSGSSFKAPEVTQIVLPPPPPPPPPPKVEPPPPKDEPPPPEEEEMIAQEEVTEEEPPPDEAPPEQPSEDLSTGITGGSGPDMGLSGKGGGGRIGGSKGRRGSGSKYGYFASRVQASVADALKRNPATRSASFSGLTVRVWADSSGRITRVQLVGTSGSPEVDRAIRNQALTGLQLPEPPPAGMPMPINMRINARKPNS
jgi:outer membrane biosynthesis protein TonB